MREKIRDWAYAISAALVIDGLLLAALANIRVL